MATLNEELLTPQQVASWLQIPLSAVYAMSHRGEIEKVKLSHRRLRFTREAVERFISEKTEGGVKNDPTKVSQMGRKKARGETDPTLARSDWIQRPAP